MNVRVFRIASKSNNTKQIARDNLIALGYKEGCQT
jgi:hypothetical protein